MEYPIINSPARLVNPFINRLTPHFPISLSYLSHLTYLPYHTSAAKNSSLFLLVPWSLGGENSSAQVTPKIPPQKPCKNYSFPHQNHPKSIQNYTKTSPNQPTFNNFLNALSPYFTTTYPTNPVFSPISRSPLNYITLLFQIFYIKSPPPPPPHPPPKTPLF